jgi:wyosine [tRNA(Phe)-imidazoG37] synthetase (radical SAM superfamily)
MDKKVSDEKTYSFGPVPSRRLGLSLGVDIVPFKVCTLDCVYCEVGRTIKITTERKEYVPVKAVLDEISKRFEKGLKADFVTITGSGEPTLNINLGKIIDGIREITNTPVAILTNGTLFGDKSVRADCTKADVILPSLDAGDEQTYQKINRPHKSLHIEDLINGLCLFRKEFSGQIWLEVFLVEGINTNSGQIDKIKEAIVYIKPDKIQLNTAVRPTADEGIKRIKFEKMQEIAANLGERCEIIVDFSLGKHEKTAESKAKDVFSILKRRPCTMEDICAGLGIGAAEALKHIDYLQKQGVIHSEKKDGSVFFATN